MNSYSDYQKYMSKIADLHYSIAVLSWDKEVYLPKDGAAHRSQQVATLSGMAHELFTKDSFGKQMLALQKDKTLSFKERRNVELTLKDYEKATKFEESFVIKKSKAISETYHSWLKAREERDWSIFAESLDKLVVIKKEESDRYAFGNHPYDSLLDLYEPAMTVEKLETIFSDVKQQLHPLIQHIKHADQIENDFLFQEFDTDEQWEYGLKILRKMGYDFDKGRQDISAHPFTTSFSPLDVRVTTRVKSNDFPMMLWSCIHEGGHALYEQGLPVSEYGLPSGAAISLGMHESQSRLWENNVGRSKAYWNYHYPLMQQAFKKQMGDISFDKFYKAINRIESNLIRTESDELHYHFHVLIRYEIERDLLAGNITTNELKENWNDRYEQYLGVRPENDVEGILQDIHWSHGSFGYFPTYSLGSFYAAQFYDQATSDIPQLEDQISQGNTDQLLTWLRDSIHQYGHQFEADEICEKITGSGLQLDSFVNYATTKFSDVYEF